MRGFRSCALRLAVLVGLSACHSVAQRKLELSEARLARAQSEQAKERAPELWQHFEQARAAALEADPDAPARRDHETEARLWLEAAIAEAERVRLSETRLSLERETLALTEQASREEQARAELAQQAETAAARALARQEAELALSRAALAPQQRAKLGRADLEAATQALLARASLVQAALELWGAPAQDLSKLTAQSERARALLAKAPEDALALADRCLFEALAQLAALHARAAGEVRDVERAALAETLAEAGAQTVRNDRGLAALLATAFARDQVAVSTSNVLARLCKLSAGYANGPVQVTAYGRTPAQAEQRARSTGDALLRAGCHGERFRVEGATGTEDELELTWLAY